jgi:hypothetical protein
MNNLKRVLKNKYLEYLKIYETYHLDRYRNKYYSLSFGQKFKKANKWLNQYPEQAHFDLIPVNYWLENIVPGPALILEIGGWRGDLAEKALAGSEHIALWHNYDLIKYNSYQKCSDERYRLITLNDYLWHLSPSIEYNALIATHMIEHISWQEFTELAGWLPSSIITVLFEAPLPASDENFSWKGDHSSHVFEKGWEQVITEMKKHEFSVVYSENNTVIFKR